MSRYVFRPKTRVSAKPSKLPKFVHIEGVAGQLYVGTPVRAISADDPLFRH
jgi:hypothetical protein